MAASLTPGNIAAEFAIVLEDASRRNAEWLILDGPPDSAPLCVQLLHRAGWQVSVDLRMHSELGDAIAQRRSWVLATKGGPLPDQ
eukprot:15680896-Heterocapsa_arctica.AAC.1